MKNLLLLIALLAGTIFGAKAQNRSINFNGSKDWDKILKEAGRAGRLVFLDCYTSWCGPCRKLSKEVFTRDKVADFFNSHFINAKFDLDKDVPGPMLKRTYKVEAFPTLLFIDPETREVVHRMVGYGDGDWLLEGAGTALDGDNNLGGLSRRFKAGDRSIGVVSGYLDALSDAHMFREAGRIATEYFTHLTDEEMTLDGNWKLAARYGADLLSVPTGRILARRDYFNGRLGKPSVDARLSLSINRIVSALATWRRPQPFMLDEKLNGKMTDLLLGIDHPDVPAALAHMYASRLFRAEKYADLLTEMKQAVRYNLFRNGSEKIYILTYMDILTYSADNDIFRECCGWLDRLCSRSNDNFYRADLMGVKARFLERLGDKEGVDAARELERQYREER